MKMTKSKILHGILFLALVLAFPGGIQSQEVDEEVLSEGEAGVVSFDFKDADVRNVLRIFSHKTGINIVASPDVQGSVTVKLNNVPWERALKIILDMNDFAYVRDGNVIKVLSKAKMAQEALHTEVVALDYAKADEVKPTLDTMLTERGAIQTDGRANLLIITDVPSQFESIMKVVKRLDAPTPQVRIESKIVETTFDVTRNFGVKWSLLNNYEIGTGAFTKSWTRSISDSWSKVLTDDQGTSLIETAAPLALEGRPGYMLTATGFEIDDMGNPAPTELSAGNATSGSQLYNFRQPDWIFNEGGFTRNFDNSLISTFTGTRSKSNASSTIVGADAVSVTLSALINDTGTDILSAPSIVTLDNKEAIIKVATDYPIPQFNLNQDTGQFMLSGFNYEPIGITMKVTPHVSPNGYVTMDLHPQISRDDGVVVFGSGGSFSAPVPLIGKEEVKTSVLVKDGDTIVLGGLVRQFDDYAKQKVPVLHSIPVLGWLFKSHDKTIQKRNLLLFVTPTILKKENAITVTQDMADSYTKSRQANEEPTNIYPNLELTA